MLILMKLLILCAVIFLGYLISFRVNVLLIQRFMTFVLGLLISVFIIFPGLSTQIANFFGIGRGVDFIFYLSHLLIFYVLVRQFLKYQRLHRSLTSVVRELAISKSEKF